jgi:hypothetical protein
MGILTPTGVYFEKVSGNSPVNKQNQGENLWRKTQKLPYRESKIEL